MFEVLDQDLEDFFFGVPTVIETQEENEKRKYTPPIKTVRYKLKINVERRDENTGALKQVPVEYNFKMRIYRNQKVNEKT